MKQYFRQLLKYVMPGLTDDMHGLIDVITSAPHVITSAPHVITSAPHVIPSASEGSPESTPEFNFKALSRALALTTGLPLTLRSLTWRTFTHFLCLIPFCLILTNCSSIQTPITDQYRLSGYSHQVLRNHPTAHSILVNKPEAVAGYETNQMLYINKPYELTPFAHNAWVNPPAEMLFPLIVESLQTSGYFFAVASSPTAESTQYRIDTQLIELHQNFLVRPSVIELTVKVVLTDAPNNHVIASKMIKERIPCVRNNPYGGVMAANEATRRFTAELTRFVIGHI